RRRHQDRDHAGPGRRSASQRSAVAREAAGSSQIVARSRGREAMTATRGLVLIASVAAAGALLRAADRTTGSPAAAARLKTISAKVHSKGPSLIIAPTEPLGHVTSHPARRPLMPDLRKVPPK